ncbi:MULTISPECIES: tetratricopeptide repeat-containing sensor histidine kinase [unclassified Tenacibaculum]|uniref:tetratricopeptide repeat-containing sensor histidine kinase n=1 Tax=unclassified Tenacibaculum TaxID=2635139 RepID=UPI001F1C4C00|nr:MULTISPECIES: tetratricopeptide repeat-containing sensor histidine kinase [unclassified Tenacibaculum]MCF2876553.1 histidine kinase [Tenacibaculum sp. Cn5-1]MCF2936540.1 histidine kinase [Tenacibaculum sp. Cn5-34]MCG7511867.1 histidine kinase [Tenacibaculum sp. Cn5-46]
MTYSNKIIILFILISSSLKASAINVTFNFFYQDKKIIKKDTSFQYVNNLYIEKKYPEALKETLILYNKAKEENNLTLMHKSSELLGEIYRKSFNYNLSLKYFKISLEYLIEKNKGINDNFNNKSSINLLAKSYLKIGATYLKIYKDLKHKNNNATYQKLIDIGVSQKNEHKVESYEKISALKDSALHFFSKIESLPPINDEVLRYKASSHINLSAIYQIDSMYVKAKKFALKAIKIHKDRNDKIKLARSQNNLGNILLLTEEFNKAKNTYTEAIEVIKKDNSEKATKLKANLYYNLAWAMRKLKDYKAYDFQELSYEIEDVLREKDIRQIVKKIEANHNENLEQQKINLVKEQRKLEEAQQAKTTLLFGALSLLVIVISGVVIYNYKLRQSNLQLKLSESDLLQQQSIEKLKSDAQIKILNATIDGKETERKQIAETLHDNVSALLSSANMHLSATKKQFNGDAPQEIEKTREIILEASQKVRDLSHNLISSILLKFGLEYALKDVVKKYSNSELKFEVKANNISRYNQEFEIKIFNVIQELINNIIKHSNASSAEIILKAENNQLTILVKDDGVGFATSSSSINDGIGLNQIEARIKMMSGKLAIDSEPDKGTEVFILVPIQQQKEYGSLSSVS